MDLELRGKRALITGGTGPLGRAAAAVLRDEGVDVVLSARNEARLAEVVAELRPGATTKVEGITADVTDEASMQTLVNGTVERLGGIDILIHGATPTVRSVGGAFPDEAQVLAELGIKALGGLRAARMVTPYMQANGWGRIIFYSGTNARMTGSTSGSIRNSAVIAMTKNENAIRRMVTADEVAWVVAFLCSPKAVSMTGEQVTVSGGWGTAIQY